MWPDDNGYTAFDLTTLGGTPSFVALPVPTPSGWDLYHLEAHAVLLIQVLQRQLLNLGVGRAPAGDHADQVPRHVTGHLLDAAGRLGGRRLPLMLAVDNRALR